ncbi:hypothetical protein BFP76_02260 [Amylibacter kogurei]|uniref:3-hydroxyisobutyryl-CoA hydrolase n=1 Tax=Paramylibacter kogurei TaxID=1889778 RepID=A0A2G5K3H3_9RHOB|nr:enoyl-CoA hydratase/isomerase family protein [Amylibacter kogurei]PIB24088.1 hypothetical protein BFP76_02260 [Amylibacter kogurei]
MDDEILIRQNGHIGHITLNRPRALNALTQGMVDAMEPALVAWATDDTIKAVVIDATGDKAFCAGGDVTQLYHESLAGNIAFGHKFWRDEYRVNAMIAAFPKPYVALMDGIVMGGGVGVSAHGSHRIVTDRTMFAMPECAIGLIPDVGGTYLLANAPGSLGEYLGITGARMNGADCIYAGQADFYVPHEQLPALLDELVKTGDVGVIANFVQTPPNSTLADQQSTIDAVFGLPDMAQINAALDGDDTEWGAKTRKQISHGAPLSAVMSLELIRAARGGDIKMALRNEYRFVSRCAEQSDFIEGVRAMLIDKDRNPNWRYKSIADIPQSLIDELMQPAPDGDLNL